MLLLTHVGHDGGLHHTIPMILCGLVIGYVVAVLVRKAREARR